MIRLLFLVLALVGCGDRRYAGLPASDVPPTCVAHGSHALECVADGRLYRCLCDDGSCMNVVCAPLAPGQP